ncbi:chromosomal replication initiator protein dnaA [Rhodopirellula europaea SH398]|uniref:Chromosomal replication initiator protein DnaA n=1 Tax=Rhodopirellula europaea SH398 TaxID=1263868 RepID=M5S0I5_9BACT|nr:chromosomal replication initiator protein dnaA [Rhodopirellula europaea SH398]
MELGDQIRPDARNRIGSCLTASRVIPSCPTRSLPFAVVASPPNVNSFALERPSLRRRRRDSEVVRPIIPLFYCGDENRLAGYVCENPIETLLEISRPMLLVGQPGTGKTALALHLSKRMSISNVWEAMEMDKDTEQGGPSGVTSRVLSSRVLYQPAIDFAREFASSIDSKDMPRFREKLDTVPILVLDDLHLIADKGPAQEELAQRLEARDAEGRLTIVTCRRLPSEVRGLRPALVSRTLPGLTVTLHPPAGDTRRTILRELMLAHLPDVEPEALSLLDAGLPAETTVRAFESAIKQVALWCRMHEQPICADAVQSAIETAGGTQSISIKAITTAVARQLGVKSADMRSGSRRQNIVRARSLAMWLARRLTEDSLTQIGDAFGGRDHSTVLHAIRKIDGSLDDDVLLRRSADQIMEKLSN